MLHLIIKLIQRRTIILNDNNSEFRIVHKDFPQSAALCPILFNLYYDHIDVENVPGAKILLFANDLCIFT